jgi:LmbE family N-acetylglucosaminyl deacetylase
MTDPYITVYPEAVHIGDSPQGRVLVLTPHADDETFGCGGVIREHIMHGDDVSVVVLSDNSDSVQEEASGQEVIDLREKEFAEAMSVLGVGKFRCLRIPPGVFGTQDRSEDIAAILIENNPDLLYLPSWSDNHHDHRILMKWTSRALKNTSSIRPTIRQYEVWSPLSATIVVDITAVMEKKYEAMDCYQSQMIAINYKHHIEGLNAFRAMTFGDSRVRYAEAFLETTTLNFRDLTDRFLS